MLTANLLPELLKVQQVANYLHVSNNTVYSWVNSGELPSFKVGNTRRIRKEALLHWMQEKEESERKEAIREQINA